MKTTLKILALMLLFCLNGEKGFGQEWEKVISQNLYIAETVQTPDSSIWISASLPNTGISITKLFKMDKNGNIKFQKNIPSEYVRICKSYDNGILALDPFNEVIQKFDKNGSLIWTKTLPFSADAHLFNIELPNKKILTGSYLGISIFSEDGALIKTKSLSGLEISGKVFYADDQKILILAINAAGDLVEIEFDYNLDIKKTTTIVENYNTNNFFLTEDLPVARDSDGAYYVAENNEKVTLKKILNEKIVWEKVIFNNSNKYYQNFLTSLELDANKNVAISGFEVIGLNPDSVLSKSNAAIWIYNENGNFKSMQRFTGEGINAFTGLSVTPDNYYLASGYKNVNVELDNVNIFLVKTKAAGLNSFISGKIAIDKNANCKADSLEQKLGGYVVKSEDTKKVQSYGVSDSDGNYWLIAPSGTNTLKVQNPSPYFQQVCDSVVQVQNGQTVERDLFLKATVDCPYMTVEMSMQGIRPCTTAVYVLKYCNKGSSFAKNAFIKVTFDPNMTYKTATKTGVLQADGTYLFSLGDVQPDFCETFTVTCDVKCDLNLVGKTLCNKAHIYPDSVCINNNNAKIQVTGNCNAGKVDFLIKNVGKNAMSATKDYYVIEDDVMYKQGTFQLNPNATLPISITAKAGKTYRIVAQQTDLTLGTITSAAIEACVSNPNGNSTGFINQFSLGDESPFEDEDCRTVVNSFDPNDKAGFPIGTKTQHFIPKNTEIDYLIRFQNSGTDTAFVVVVKDTLSAFLDPATIVTGASSHPYRFTLTDKGVVSFIFEKINLPHEKVNKDGSNGFVKFKIKQRANNPNGTVINNHAAIFFDFNLPIITNTTTHTIGENWITILTGSEDVKNNLLTLKIYPNPFQENARIEIEENSYNNLIFNVLDLNGKMIRSEKFSGNTLNFEKGNLTQGFYMYQVTSEAKILQTGKMIVN